MAPVRLGLALFALAAVATVTSLRGSDEAMVWVYDHITHPYHAFMSRISANWERRFQTSRNTSLTISSASSREGTR